MNNYLWIGAVQVSGLWIGAVQAAPGGGGGGGVFSWDNYYYRHVAGMGD